MMIINKKRIQIIILSLFISLLSFAFQISKDNNEILEKTNNNSNNTIQTTATPVSGKTIIVDAGHGTPDEGAESKNRYNRSTNKLTNCSETTKSIRN